ncbi:MAG: OmpA family protein [Prevotella sp.]|nr:OmpA family protein [Prevotella sp.]
MKKIAMFIAAAAMVATASAEPRTVITASKAQDNVYVGVNGGAITALKGESSMKAFTPNFGVRVGKNFTTVLGLAIEGTAYFNPFGNNSQYKVSKTIVQGVDVNLLGTANLMNLFAGYNGQPRDFEIIALGGFGWTHAFGTGVSGKYANGLNTRLALDFAYNFGADKQWQLYLEPSIEWAKMANYMEFKYNVREAGVGLKAGVNYKFKTSNGTSNFAVEQLRDQSEIDALNAKINAARSEADAAKAAAAAKDAQIAQLKKALADCEAKPAVVKKETKTEAYMPPVVFQVGKSVIDKNQQQTVDLIAKYMKKNANAKLEISGYASPEGDAAKNQALSEARANSVKDMLVKKYKIAANRITTVGKGVMVGEGADDIEAEFKRIALFKDLSK